ncbi:hypothetical protein CFOL_v3_18388 [Cephalotus follicularis]|uniref:Uncharacterized protein n=1 Tax=Cephalotus follicularis TaxID=3775 RepID=A0A1Q3C4A4_CEPFO|nr:hypothetical protein CFOL_v3_18388 [Cephalotus follicularis]
MAAGAHCATFSIMPPSKIHIKPKTPISSASPHFHSQPTKRKNQLRPKILKTLSPKPLPSSPQLPPPNPIIPISSPSQHDTVFDPPPDQIPVELSSPVDEVKEFQVSETTPDISGEYSCGFGNFSMKSALKYGFLYVVGVILYQTISTFWKMRSVGSDKKDENLNDLEVAINGIDKGKVLLNGKSGSTLSNVGYWDESDLEFKIQEIRAMAKEAREIEKRELKNDDVGEIFNGSAGSKYRIGIEKEVGERLVKLKKRLNSKRENLPISFINYLDKFGNVKDEIRTGSLDAKEENKNLMFEKKFKYKGPSMNAISKPKGFQGLVDDNVDKNEYDSSATVKRSESVDGDGFDVVAEGEQIGIVNGGRRKSVVGTVEMDSGREVSNLKLNCLKNGEKESGRAKMIVEETDTSSGAVQGSRKRSYVEVMESENLKHFGTQKPQNFTKEKQKTATKSDKQASVGRKGSSKHGEVGSELLANKVRDQPADFKTDLWWLNLPYVLAILMRRGSNSGGLEGLYTMSVTSLAQDEDSTYTVAFEDRRDANNYCYVLESFFEDLGDFRADIVHLSIKELLDIVDSDTKKVIVVKKGQLKLYAGQPLADAEMAVHSLLLQNQNEHLKY